MSGGKFNYNEYKILEIAGELEDIILDNLSSRDLDATNYSLIPEASIKEESMVKESLKKAVSLLLTSYNMVKNIDFLLSGDIGVKEYLNYLEDIK